MTVLLELCLELVQTPHQINDECILLLRCQVLDVGHLRHVPHYAQPGSSLQALNSYAAAKKSRCRPAQGRRLKQANTTRMPAKKQKNPTTVANKKSNQSTITQPCGHAHHSAQSS